MTQGAHNGTGSGTRRHWGGAAFVRSLRPFYLAASLCVTPAAQGQTQTDIDFSPQEIQQILTLGPWPPAPVPDPSNRVSGQPKAIELGRRLFADTRLSAVGYISCVTCHQPDRAFTDLKARAHGLADLPRNTPTLVNMRQQQSFGRDGASDSLWMASIRPILDSREFDSNPATVARLFARDPELAACYRSVFKTSPMRSSSGDEERTLVNVGKALAAFQETFVTARTTFDAFRDSLAAPAVSNSPAVSAYPAAAQRGLKLFVGQAGCITCHQGANFSDGEFHNVSRADPGGPDEGNQRGEKRGVRAAPRQPVAGPAGAVTPPDAGRLAGAINVLHNPFNLAGVYNDDPKRASRLANPRQVPDEGLRGQFRTPSLRNVTTTAPYMHDGRIDSLRDAVMHGGKRGPVADVATDVVGNLSRSAFPAVPPSSPHSSLKSSPHSPPHSPPLSSSLAAHQVDDLVAFLATLTDHYGERRPWSSHAVARCP